MIDIKYKVINILGTNIYFLYEKANFYSISGSYSINFNLRIYQSPDLVFLNLNQIINTKDLFKNLNFAIIIIFKIKVATTDIYFLNYFFATLKI